MGGWVVGWVGEERESVPKVFSVVFIWNVDVFFYDCLGIAQHHVPFLLLIFVRLQGRTVRQQLFDFLQFVEFVCYFNLRFKVI